MNKFLAKKSTKVILFFILLITFMDVYFRFQTTYEIHPFLEQYPFMVPIGYICVFISIFLCIHLAWRGFSKYYLRRD